MSARPTIDRRALFASGAAAALLAATGVSARPRPERGGRLRIALSGADRSDRFDTRAPLGLFMQVATTGIVFDTLTEIAADGTLRGELATGWHGSADALTWDFDLRPGVFFHDGAAFEPRDVVTSFDMHRSGLLANVSNIEIAGADKVCITLTTPDADFPYRLSAPQLIIYPTQNIARAMEQGIGTGLYRAHRFLPGRQFVGLRVEDHYKDGHAGWFDSVELVSVPSADVRAEALRDRFVDAVDVTDAGAFDGLSDISLLPEARLMTHAAHEALALPSQIGTRWPMDNLRASERWWMG